MIPDAILFDLVISEPNNKSFPLFIVNIITIPNYNHPCESCQAIRPKIFPYREKLSEQIYVRKDRKRPRFPGAKGEKIIRKSLKISFSLLCGLIPRSEAE